MALGFFFLGVILLVSGWRGTWAQAGALLAADFSGFLALLIAVIAIGAIGYVPELKGLSDALLILVIMVMLFKNNGVFSTWASIAQSPPQASAPAPAIPTADQPALTSNPTININAGGSSSGSSGALGTASQAIGLGAKILGFGF